MARGAHRTAGDCARPESRADPPGAQDPLRDEPARGARHRRRRPGAHPSAAGPADMAHDRRQRRVPVTKPSFDEEEERRHLETAIEIYDQDEVVVSCFFLNSGDTVVLEPHFYDATDVLIGVGPKVTYTPTTSSSASKTIVSSPAAAFPAPFEFLANPGANYLRLKATTLPSSSSVGVFVGHRA